MDKIGYYTLTVPNGPDFEIAVGTGFWDPIGEQIASGDYPFPTPLCLAFDLLRPGCRVMDLGAHIGTFSLAAAALGCQVVSVEASPYNAELLKASIAQNRFHNMRVVAAAVSDHSGTLEFVQGGPFGFVSESGAGQDTVQVPAVTVDELLTQLGWDRVNLIKMDVEGSEIAAIRGMAGLLHTDDAPPIIYESNGHTLHLFGQSPQRLIASFEQSGYASYQIEPGRLTPVDSAALQPECVVDYLAAKGPPRHLKGWRAVQPATRHEIIARIVSAAAHPHEEHRAYLSHALADARPAILLDRRVTHVLRSLCVDPSAKVRSAVSWFDPQLLGPSTEALHERVGRLRSATKITDSRNSDHMEGSSAHGPSAHVQKSPIQHRHGSDITSALERQVAFNQVCVQSLDDVVAVQADECRRAIALEIGSCQTSAPGMGGVDTPSRIAGGGGVPLRAYVMGPAGPTVDSLVRLLEGQGAVVTDADPVPRGLDLYIFATGHEAMMQLPEGLVVLDLRADVGRANAGWLPYADVCFVSEAASRVFLVENYGCEPERIFVVPDDETLSGVLDRVLHGELSPFPCERLNAHEGDATPVRTIRALANRVAAAEHQVDVRSMRDTERQGRLLPRRLTAWLRGSPVQGSEEAVLREALDRQVALNRDVVAILRGVVHLQADLEVRLADRKRGTAMMEDQAPIIQIRDPAVDGEGIARRVCQQVAQHRGQGGYGPDPASAGPEALRIEQAGPDLAGTGEPAVLRQGMAQLLSSGELREPGFTSSTPVLGRLIVALRRFWNWMSTKWYVRPLIKQQTQVNLQTAHLISELAQWHELDARRLDQLEARAARLEGRLGDVERI